jgi:hypothetical protein
MVSDADFGAKLMSDTAILVADIELALELIRE